MTDEEKHKVMKRLSENQTISSNLFGFIVSDEEI